MVSTLKMRLSGQEFQAGSALAPVYLTMWAQFLGRGPGDEMGHAALSRLEPNFFPNRLCGPASG